MQITKQRIAVMLAAAGLANAAVNAKEPIPPDDYKPQNAERYQRTDRMHGQHIKATKLIGKEVKNDQDERLGKVEDLIIDSKYSVNFAVISSGGALGIGDTRIAVPINSLNCSGEEIRLSATKEQLKEASKTPTGAWAAVSGQEWTRDVDCYYGQPTSFSLAETGRYDDRRYDSGYDDRPYRTFERETLGTSLEREPVRAVQGDGARKLITHPEHANLFKDPLIGSDSSAPAMDTSDETMQQQICDKLQQISTPANPQGFSVTVENGNVTLRGTVANAAERKNIETTVKQMSGVRRVNNQLTIETR